MELLDLLQEETEFDSNVFIAIDTIMKMLEVEELK